MKTEYRIEKRANQYIDGKFYYLYYPQFRIDDKNWNFYPNTENCTEYAYFSDLKTAKEYIKSKINENKVLNHPVEYIPIDENEL